MNQKLLPFSNEEIIITAKKFKTPYYLYDEKGIIENLKNLNHEMSIFPNFKEHFAVKACPNPTIMETLKKNGSGFDCSSLPELLLCEKIGVSGEDIMFTSNQTPTNEFKKALKMNAIINLDDISHIEIIDKITNGKFPEILSFRYNPGGDKIGNSIIGSPKDAKYGLTKQQIFEGYKILKSKGVKRFGIHTMIASNELKLEHHKEVARMIFALLVEIRDTIGITLEFVNLGGGVGIPYQPKETKISWADYARTIKEQYDEILTKNDITNVSVKTEFGRPITGPYGFLVVKAIRHKDTYKNYIGVDASMADLMRPGLYGAYHHISVIPQDKTDITTLEQLDYDIVGSLCENSDKFAIDRRLPLIFDHEEKGDLLVIHDTGAHGHAMGFNYNGKLRPKELLKTTDGNTKLIRRAETIEDLFATLNF